MGNRIPTIGGTVLALALLGACTETPPTEPGQSPSLSADHRAAQEGPRFARGLDAEFSRLAGEVPGFGGMFRGDDGRLHVYVREASAARGPAVADLATRLQRELRASEVGGPMGRDLVVHEARYDFRELAAWNERAIPLLGVEGVVFTHADESRNRLRIGIESGASQERIEAAVRDLGIPADAVVFDLTDPIVPLVDETLRDLQRPRAGGPQIVFERPGVGFFVCTLGFNILRNERGASVPYFITNSHCSAERGEVTGTEYFQHLPPQFTTDPRPTFVGAEVEDPPFFTAPCFTGFVCRWSDALVARYDRANPVNLGAIYQTAFFGTGLDAGSLEVGGDRGRFFHIRGESDFLMVGDVVDKIGRTTGWTRGEVVATCANVGVFGTNIAMLCQDIVAAAVAGGDSGSPVFSQIGDSNDAVLHGILWGGGTGIYVFSALENIREDLGDFRTH